MTRDAWEAPDLKGRVAVVTGATRGVGRGIAEVLGQCGMTVYVTGRSTRAAGATEDLPGTVEGAAEAVTDAGGRGVGVVCDHTIDGQVEALFRQVADDEGRLDVLVNNVWGGYEAFDASFDAPFWEEPADRWDRMFAAGTRAHHVASRLAAPTMVKVGAGVIVNTSAGDGAKYRGSVPYDVAKTATERMAWAMARELRPHGVAALALQSGFARTERVLAHFGGDADHPDLEETHSPHYVGRAVAALAADADVMEKSGEVLAVGDVAREYGFTDVDGRHVPAFRFPEEYE